MGRGVGYCLSDVKMEAVENCWNSPKGCNTVKSKEDFFLLFVFVFTCMLLLRNSADDVLCFVVATRKSRGSVDLIWISKLFNHHFSCHGVWFSMDETGTDCCPSGYDKKKWCWCNKAMWDIFISGCSLFQNAGHYILDTPALTPMTTQSIQSEYGHCYLYGNALLNFNSLEIRRKSPRDSLLVCLIHSYVNNKCQILSIRHLCGQYPPVHSGIILPLSFSGPHWGWQE